MSWVVRMAASGGGENGNSARQLVITLFPMAIAVLSLVTSIYNGYLNNKFVTMIQGGLSRSEYARTCRDTIDAYFQVKHRAELLAEAANRQPAGGKPDDAAAREAVARFGALATYLANLREEAVRERYTELYWTLGKLATTSAGGDTKGREKLIGEADAIFTVLNDDCIATAKRQN